MWERPKVIKLYGNRVVVEDEDTGEAYELVVGSDGNHDRQINFLRNWYTVARSIGIPLA